jgi:hypothetical protein
MNYLKGVLVGMVAALIASVLYIVAVFVLPILVPFLLSRMAGTGGAGGAGASISEGAVLGIAVIAFAAGFYWQLRRGSTVRQRAR